MNIISQTLKSDFFFQFDQAKKEKEREYSAPFVEKLALAFAGDGEGLVFVLELAARWISMNLSLPFCY